MFMVKRRRRGFTLVELLVVMSIIAMLAGLLLPAVNSVRETGRKTTCMNNIRNLAIALQNHEAQRGYLPGMANRQDARVMYVANYDGTKYSPVVNQRTISWVFPTLPFIEKDDLFRAYSQPHDEAVAQKNSSDQWITSRGEPNEHIKLLVCPNDTSAINNLAALSYVANCGLREKKPAEPGPNVSGVDADGGAWDMREQQPSTMFITSVPGNPRRGSIQYASAGDGASSTFLLSENMDASRWSHDTEGRVGFCWIDVTTSPATGSTTGTATMAPNHGPIGVNDMILPRASSYHPGGFVVAFADAHVAFLNTNIAWDVYIRLFTPRGDSVVFRPGSTTADIATQQLQSTPLSETY